MCVCMDICHSGDLNGSNGWDVRWPMHHEQIWLGNRVMDSAVNSAKAGRHQIELSALKCTITSNGSLLEGSLLL